MESFHSFPIDLTVPVRCETNDSLHRQFYSLWNGHNVEERNWNWYQSYWRYNLSSKMTRSIRSIDILGSICPALVYTKLLFTQSLVIAYAFKTVALYSVLCITHSNTHISSVQMIQLRSTSCSNHLHSNHFREGPCTDPAAVSWGRFCVTANRSEILKEPSEVCFQPAVLESSTRLAVRQWGGG